MRMLGALRRSIARFSDRRRERRNERAYDGRPTIEPGVLNRAMKREQIRRAPRSTRLFFFGRFDRLRGAWWAR